MNLTSDRGMEILQGQHILNPEAQYVLSEVQKTPEMMPLGPVSYSEFLSPYLHATKAIIKQFVEETKELELDVETIFNEYLAQYGIVSEQDHINSINLALRDLLPIIDSGGKVYVILRGTSRTYKSQYLMANTLFGVMSELVDPNQIELIDTVPNFKNIRDILNRDKQNGSLHLNKLAIPDDALYSGNQMYSFMGLVYRTLKEIAEDSDGMLTAYVAYQDDPRYQKITLPYLNIRTVRTRPDPVSIKQYKYFRRFLYQGDVSGAPYSDFDYPRGITTEYKLADRDSVNPFFHEWGEKTRLIIDQGGEGVRLAIAFLKQIGLLEKGGVIDAFPERKYPKPDILIQKVLTQFFK